MYNISAVIIAKNEEKNISKCLESLHWADEIVIVDDYSVDKTKEYALKCKKVKFYENKFVDFSSQRNFAASKSAFDWILSLDADEIITNELKEEILMAIEDDSRDAYNIPTKNFFWGKWMRYGGWYPNYHIRLFRRDKASWERQFDEFVKISGKVGFIKKPILHYGHNTPEETLSKNKKYALMEARINRNQKVKFSWAKLIYFTARDFFNRFFIKLGFLDGVLGFKLALFYAYYNALIWFNLYNLEKNSMDDHG